MTVTESTPELIETKGREIRSGVDRLLRKRFVFRLA